MIVKNGKRLINWIQEKGWYVMNGSKDGDWEGEFTYVRARGSTVIDYVFVNEDLYERNIDFKIDDRIESDHMPLNIMVDINVDWKEDRRSRKRKDEDIGDGRIKEERVVICWDKETIQRYKEETKTMVNEEAWESSSIENKWYSLKEWVLGSMIKKKIKIKKKELGHKD